VKKVGTLSAAGWAWSSARGWLGVVVARLAAATLSGRGARLHIHYNIHLMDFFSMTTWVSQHHKGKPFWIILEQKKMRWVASPGPYANQIICTSLQTDNHASTSPLSFYRSYALPGAKPTASKH